VSNEVGFGVRFSASGGQQVVGEIKPQTAAIDQLNVSAQRATQAHETWRRNMAGVAASMKETSSASVELSAATQRILDRYDPLGTKLRALQSDMSTLRKEMGNSTTDAAIKGFQGLEDEIDKTRALMAQAGVASDGHGKTMSGLGLNTQYARRELMMLGREALTGDFRRCPRRSHRLSLIQICSLSQFLQSGLLYRVTAALVAGAVAWQHWRMLRLRAPKKQ